MSESQEIKLYDYIDEFSEALKRQLISDQRRWGDTWIRRPRKNQEERAWNRLTDYFDRNFIAGTPVPWLKVAGEAMIGWMRENHTELNKEWDHE